MKSSWHKKNYKKIRKKRSKKKEQAQPPCPAHHNIYISIHTMVGILSPLAFTYESQLGIDNIQKTYSIKGG